METEKIGKTKVYIFKRGERHFLRVGNNMWASPCRCPLERKVHFHHNLGVKNEPMLFVVEEGKNYPEE